MQSMEMTIDHKGKPFKLPFVVNQATSVHLYSLLDYEAACSLCEKENFKPIILKTQNGVKKAAGFISAIDNKITSSVPYREWSFGLFVMSKEKETAEVDFVNETSLFFQSMTDDDHIGNTTFCPKLILNESLPTEIGLEYYGIPKELGEVNYDYGQKVSEFSVSPRNDSWVMRATFPTKGGIFAKFGLLRSMFKAYSFSVVFESMKKKEFAATLVGSTEILAKMAKMKIKRDPKTEMFPWNKQDCQIEINPESRWGKVLINLKIQPELICHVPNLEFEFSEPFDQI